VVVAAAAVAAAVVAAAAVAAAAAMMKRNPQYFENIRFGVLEMFLCFSVTYFFNETFILFPAQHAIQKPWSLRSDSVP